MAKSLEELEEELNLISEPTDDFVGSYKKSIYDIEEKSILIEGRTRKNWVIVEYRLSTDGKYKEKQVGRSYDSEARAILEMQKFNANRIIKGDGNDPQI